MLCLVKGKVMSVRTLINDIIGFYLWQGKYWLIFTYLVTLVASIIIIVFGLKKRLNKTRLLAHVWDPYSLSLMSWLIE